MPLMEFRLQTLKSQETQRVCLPAHSPTEEENLPSIGCTIQGHFGKAGNGGAYRSSDTGPKGFLCAPFCTQAYEKPDLLNDNLPLEIIVGKACLLLDWLQTLFVNAHNKPVRYPCLGLWVWGQGGPPELGPTQAAVHLSHPLHFSALLCFLKTFYVICIFYQLASSGFFWEVRGYK